MVRPIPAEQLPAALQEATKARGDLVLVAMASLPNCPWCDLVLRDQLLPRMRSADRPQLRAVILDITDRRPMRRPGADRPEVGLEWLAQSPQQWARWHRIRMAPTVFPIDLAGRPIGEPLVGYSSVDFYGAYLEDRIQLAKAYWARGIQTGAAT
jgi:thioredoxin-related protein